MGHPVADSLPGRGGEERRRVEALGRHAELLAQRQPITAARALAVTEAIERSAPAPGRAAGPWTRAPPPA